LGKVEVRVWSSRLSTIFARPGALKKNLGLLLIVYTNRRIRKSSGTDSSIFHALALSRPNDEHGDIQIVPNRVDGVAKNQVL